MNKLNDYILESINNEGYNDDILTTDKELLQFLHDTFYSEAGWNVQRVGLNKAVKEWCQGLPSSLDIVFYNYDILCLYKDIKMLQDQPGEETEDAYIEEYWNELPESIIAMWNDNNIN